MIRTCQRILAVMVLLFSNTALSACPEAYLGSYQRGYDNTGHAGDFDWEYLSLSCHNGELLAQYRCERLDMDSYDTIRYSAPVNVRLDGDVIHLKLPRQLAADCRKTNFVGRFRVEEHCISIFPVNAQVGWPRQVFRLRLKGRRDQPPSTPRH